MSSALTIAAVSVVLRDLLHGGLVDARRVGPVEVTAVAPDTIRLDGPHVEPRLNLFLYSVTTTPGGRSTAPPSYARDGGRGTNPPLGLDLHYLVTAYGDADFEAEVLLGHAMQALRDRPVLDRDAIRTSLDDTPLGDSGPALAEQIDRVTVVLEPMDVEEMSRLWSAIRCHYRPSVAYVVSLVLAADG